LKIWDPFITFSKEIVSTLSSVAQPRRKIAEFDNVIHTTTTYTASFLDTGSLTSIIDARETRGLWMMHTALFAADNRPSPIYGFDIICSATKVTGCFHDLSPTTEPSPFTHDYNSTRSRPLPDWAKEIFSPNMIATALPNSEQITALTSIGLTTLSNYVTTLTEHPTTSDQEYINAHMEGKRKYCYNQLQNTNSKNVIVSLGLSEEYVTEFKKDQFPH